MPTATDQAPATPTGDQAPATPVADSPTRRERDFSLDPKSSHASVQATLQIPSPALASTAQPNSPIHRATRSILSLIDPVPCSNLTQKSSETTRHSNTSRLALPATRILAGELPTLSTFCNQSPSRKTPSETLTDSVEVIASLNSNVDRCCEVTSQRTHTWIAPLNSVGIRYCEVHLQLVCKAGPVLRSYRTVERSRWKKLNEYLALLRSLMPPSYAQKGDQASIVGGNDTVPANPTALADIEVTIVEIPCLNSAENVDPTPCSQIARCNDYRKFSIVILFPHGHVANVLGYPDTGGPIACFLDRF
ncbi:Transcription factor bHLH96 [Dendrobium catenatum]|uniref:Transcription factor bHLH96 n=1 Tax=Dendrobium catenatum TaxID=906689 RepID=A0A2I0W7W1_9ASPA|nr:Transcription factor bHLH96 [Dendrobium catenatum]